MYKKSKDGEMILIERLSGFIPDRGWNEGTRITLDDVAEGILISLPEQKDEFGNNADRMAFPKDDDWHIGRVIYFINHPDEIYNIQIDNICNGMTICPIPFIEDGNHRFMAAMWLNDKGKMDRVHCVYGGRMDLLDYLTGKTDELPLK
ncbi:hypothetical protein [Lacrimispora amygdalina]|uniref:hypothetical protein n=1 Tax=Lacrimispora amygdalina TaxID=253257 RepID=UPI000BE2D4EF|nr:hypothetical protein [Lacrimispora amygdalina]